MFSKNHRGFTLLVAVLVASILLSIGTSIFNIAFKELILASSGKESQKAFFAADSAMECALYWDQKYDAFNVDSPKSTITCEGNPIIITSSTYKSTYTREFDMNIASGGCASVLVTKYDRTVNSTQIEARGHNTCSQNDPRRSERAIRIKY